MVVSGQMIFRLLAVCVLIIRGLNAQVATDRKPKLTTPGQHRFRTAIRRSVAKGPNFAGRFTIAEWGCGTGCIQVVVVDNESGDVYESPFGTLPKAALCLGANPDEDRTGITYRLDSSLLIVRGCSSNWKDCRAVSYDWTGAEFKVLRATPMRPVFGCDWGPPEEAPKKAP